MANEDKIWAAPGITTNFSLGGLANLINPFSRLYKSNQDADYVPGWWIKAFSSGGADKTYDSQMGPSKVAHVLAKVITGGAVFGGAAWLLRSFLHSLDIDNVENIKSSARASRKLQTTKMRPTAPAVNYKVPEVPAESSEDLKKKQKQAGNMQKKQSYQMLVSAAPTLTALASILAATKLADKYYDNKLGRTLDRELSVAKAQSQDLALDRILRNRGLQEQSQEGVADAYNQQMTSKAKQRKQQKQIKSASLEKKEKLLPQGIESALGLTLFTMLALGSTVGYKWQQSNSPALAKYKAYKKGLETYNKERALSQNIESTPLNKEFLDYLDTNVAGAKKQAPAEPAETSLKELMI